MTDPFDQDDLRGLHVLLVDDNALNQQLAEAYLDEVGVSVVVADNGRIALQRLETEIFDVVLMDIQMPVMDGYEATRQLRLRESLAGVPVVAMTAHELAEVREACAAAGMDDVLTKPVMPEQLFAMLRKHGLRGRPSPLPVHGAGASVISAIDEVQGLHYAGNKPELYVRLLRRFQETQHDLMARIEHARERGDEVELYRLIHTLKSSAATVGARGLSEAAKAIEADFDGGRGTPTAATLSALAQTFDEVMRWIEARLEADSNGLR